MREVRLALHPAVLQRRCDIAEAWLVHVHATILDATLKLDILRLGRTLVGGARGLQGLVALNLSWNLALKVALKHAGGALEVAGVEGRSKGDEGRDEGASGCKTQGKARASWMERWEVEHRCSKPSRACGAAHAAS
jgi:hypothetical protein